MEDTTLLGLENAVKIAQIAVADANLGLAQASHDLRVYQLQGQITLTAQEIQTINTQPKGIDVAQ